ncbi:HlyD family efflux transporter periplasmic adaptor subunit [Sphingomonas sp. MAH-20]|uniref:HlyD family efflux transporter periplasmic adaptor subunit n=2 Tax=Sphingomonadaceae TaxID=41297 RepID=A0A6I4J478_9SPHN|nr:MULTISPECIES: efflux RND transporter periplasmic adaptor subunit [Sphingomonas]MBA2921248.1 efflux RND transporter periplasmic adaptor subunit [Sphingomonas sp. CGMCC 1.13658]MVO79489.1 HlyD family efflux transporter periplasmic adaptor subunit [Sphingomonas horti]
MPVGDVEDTAPALRARRKRWFGILALVLLAGAVVWGIWFLLTQAGRVSTDNAYVGADTAQVTPLISAPVAEVRVANTQAVKKGDILVVLDPADARIEVAQAQSALAQAEQKYRQARANVGAAQGRAAARGSEIEQARARLRDAEATLNRAGIELRRREALISSGAVSGDELTAARTAFQSAQAARALARAGVESAEATQAAATGELNASEALVEGTSIGTAPEILAARARLQQAKLNLERTVIRAPIDGIVTNRQVQVGQRVAAGAPVMTLVPIAAAYVDANFKEDQLAKVRPGQPVELTSDFYGGDVVFHGRVVGFAGGTGAAFALIPAQNATGNWIKVVQRLPVRIALDPKELKAHPLRVGLSMEATVDTRGS